MTHQYACVEREFCLPSKLGMIREEKHDSNTHQLVHSLRGERGDSSGPSQVSLLLVSFHQCDCIQELGIIMLSDLKR